jgi:hypothetical protein
MTLPATAHFAVCDSACSLPMPKRHAEITGSGGVDSAGRGRARVGARRFTEASCARRGPI